jgi:hypothetical protein
VDQGVDPEIKPKYHKKRVFFLVSNKKSGKPQMTIAKSQSTIHRDHDVNADS